MQTPGLPASSPSSSRSNAAESFLSEKPSQGADYFGDVMRRAMDGGPSVPPVRTGTHGQNGRDVFSHDDEHDTENNSSVGKPKKPLRRASDAQPLAGSSASANAHLIALTAPATPTPAPTPSQPTGNAHESSQVDNDPLAPLSADASNTTVKDANPAEAKASDSTGKPIPAGLEPHSAETDGSVEHPQTPPATDIAQALATEAAAVETATDPAKPTLSADSASPLTQITESKNPIESQSASPPNAHGIPAAKQDMTMKKAEKMQKVAGPGEQDLPGNSATGSEELPKGQKISEKAASHGEKVDSTAIELPTRVSTSVESPSATITSAAPAASLDTRVLERTHDIVALHAMRLTDTGADSLHVVVKPGAGIQISLELRQSARGIEVSASLHKGDYDQLSQHWPDLQQRLEARGVRVGTLTPSENYTGTGHHFHQSKQQSSQQESLHAGAFAEFALAGSMTEAPAARAARASAYRGWETWA